MAAETQWFHYRCKLSPDLPQSRNVCMTMKIRSSATSTKSKLSVNHYGIHQIKQGRTSFNINTSTTTMTEDMSTHKRYLRRTRCASKSYASCPSSG